MPDTTLSLIDLDAWHKENPYSKFAGPASEKLWDSSMECGHDEDLGEADSFGWYALFNFSDNDEAKQFCCDGMVGAILMQGSSGHISCDTYDTAEALNTAWNALETAWEEFEGEDDTDDEDEEE